MAADLRPTGLVFYRGPECHVPVLKLYTGEGGNMTAGSGSGPVKGLCGRFYLSEAPSPLMTLYFPPHYTLFTCLKYTVLVHTGEGGGVGES
jgi:hypothetical protein